MIKNNYAYSGDKVYYLDAEGLMKKDSLLEINGRLFYAGSTGALVRNQWETIEGHNYYFTRNMMAIRSYDDNYRTVYIGGIQFEFDHNGFAAKIE